VSKRPSNLVRLKSLLQSSCPCVSIVTDEEDYALDLVREAASFLNRPLRIWSVVRGVTDGVFSPPRALPDTENPAAALVRLASLDDGGITAMLDLAPHLSDERTLRALRDLIARIEMDANSAGKLVLIDHEGGGPALPGIVRAYAGRLEIHPPDEAEIEEIIVATLRRVNRERPLKIDLKRSEMQAIVRNLRGLTRRQVEQAITEAVWEDRAFEIGDLDRILARKRELVRSDGLLEFVQAPTSMEEIGGLAALKRWLAHRESALSEEAAAYGLEPPRGILMLGVQGAGKSLCAKAIATAWKRPLMRLDPGVLYDRYIGESERRLREALKQAEMMAPVVLWIDEIEKAFAGAASRSIDGGLSQRMFGTLLTWMQEHKEPVFLAATANDIEALPPELLRKGRFDEIFFVDLPGAGARRQIFAIHLRKRKREVEKFDLETLAAASEGYSGAEIEQAVAAGMHEAFNAKKKVTTEHIAAALRGSPPLSVTMAERIAGLREWARGRCVPAD
jgi:ATP-dependent 26S proteasome regulatory subunit